MADRIAILCPGQAGQHAGMFDFIREDEHAYKRLQSWPLEEVCGHALDDVLKDERLLFANRMAQPLVVAATLATWEAVRTVIPQPTIVAGYSIGELASWSVAGALEPAETIRLAATRAALLQSCIAPDQPQTMLAISLSQSLMQSDDLAKLLHANQFFSAIEVDEENIIAGGLLAHADQMAATITASGGKITRLPIEIASHTPWMRDAVQPFENALAASGMVAPRIPVLAGVSGARLHDPASACSALSRQLAEPIRWHAVLDGIHEAGVTMAIELGPGAALSKMLKARHPHIHCRSIADFRSMAGVKKWVTQHLDD